MTDLVKGLAASSDSLLRKTDYDVPAFLSKMDEFKPRIVAFNGMDGARRVFRFLRAQAPRLGPTQTHIGASRVFVLPSSSGANADRRNFLPKASKVEWWSEFGTWLRSG